MEKLNLAKRAQARENARALVSMVKILVFFTVFTAFMALLLGFSGPAMVLPIGICVFFLVLSLVFMLVRLLIWVRYSF